MPIALWALTVSAFAIGTTEFVIVGLIPTMAADLGVSLPSAGLLVSLYALGVAIGAPVLTALSGRWPRKRLLLALMLLFTAGNLLAWLAPGYGALVVARVLTGLAHGVFFSIGSTIATSLVPREKAASAIATMFSGLTVALVTGVPLGTFVGQHFGWRATFLAVAALGLIAFVASLVFVPRKLAQPAPASLRHQLEPLRQPRLLLVYGVSVAAGNVWGGKLADRRGPVGALKRIFLGLAAVLFVLSVTAHSPAAAVLTVLAWGAFAFGNVPGLQLYVVQQAEAHAPKAVDVASGLNIAAFNLGIAGGAWGGGLIVERLGLMHTPWIGAIVVLGAFALTALAGRLDRRFPLPRRAPGAAPMAVGH